MLTITKPAVDRIDIDFNGEIDADIMRDALDDLIAKSEGVENGRMLYRITDFSMPTLGAIGVELSRLPGLFSLLGKFDRCAVLCEAAWIRNVAAIEGMLIPGFEVRAYDLDETDAAEAWLSKGHS